MYSKNTIDERYCPWKCEWQPMPPMLISRTNFACEIMNGNIYVVGGYGGQYICTYLARASI